MWFSCISLDHMAVKSWWVSKSCEMPLWRPPCLTWEQHLSSISCSVVCPSHVPQQRYMVYPSQTPALTWDLPCDQCGSPPQLLANTGTARGLLCSSCSSTGFSGACWAAPACSAGGFPSFTKQPALAAVLAAVMPVQFTGFDVNLQEHPSAWYQHPWIKVALSRPKNKEHCSIKKNTSY